MYASIYEDSLTAYVITTKLQLNMSYTQSSLFLAVERNGVKFGTRGRSNNIPTRPYRGVPLTSECLLSFGRHSVQLSQNGLQLISVVSLRERMVL